MSLNKNYLIIGSILIAGLLLILSFSGRSRMESRMESRMNFHMKNIFLLAGYQTEIMLTEIDKTRKEDPGLVSPGTIKSGKLTLVPATDWTSGFFAGNLWFLYEYTGDETWRKDNNKPACFYWNSAPAHHAYPAKKILRAAAERVELGKVDLISPFIVSKQVVKGMMQRRAGKIINICRS